MTDAREVAVTAGLSFAAMVSVFGALGLWVAASIARDPGASGSVTLRLAGAGVCALVGVVLFAIAVRRVRSRFRIEQ